MKLEKNIKRRGRTYYFCKMVRGKYIRQTLETEDIKVARSRAEDLLERIQAGAWDEVARVKKFEAGVPSVEKLLEAFREYGRHQGLREVTVKDYVNALLRVLREVGHADPAAVRLTVIDAALARAFFKAYLDARGDSVSVRRSANKVHRSARAIFSKAAMQWYAENGVRVPDGLRGFCETAALRVKPVEYELPSEALRDRTLTAGRALKDAVPSLYVPFVLGYDLGMRAGEMVGCSWDWFERGPRGHVLVMVIRARADGFVPKSARGRTLPVNAETMQELREIAGGRKYLVPGETLSARERFVMRSFSDWMRSVGWDRDKYPKAGHELRKLCGLRWFSELGPQVAQEWLGHRDVATTCKYYARLINRNMEALPREKVG